MYTTDDLPFFLCYENGMIPQFEDLVGDILEQRDAQSLESSFNTNETVEIEILNFLCYLFSQRRRELDRLDHDFAKAKRFVKPILMGICKLVSENWTYMVSISHRIAFGMLLMIGRVIFDKTQF